MINDLLDIGSILILVINLFLGFLVYIRNKKSIINKIFLGIAISTGIWLSGLLIIAKADPSFFLLGGRLAFAGASLIPLFFLLFSFVFPKREAIPNLF